MKVSDLNPGDMLDLENLNLPGSAGVVAETEHATVEDIETRGGGFTIYNDMRNLVVTFDAELTKERDMVYRFNNPADVSRTWTW